MIYLGTTGWAYKHWRGPFYPRNIENELEFYSNHSFLNEINTTFYQIPSESMVRIWFHYTPEDFIFSAKLLRQITHTSRFTLKSEIVERFFDRMKGLEDKLKLVLLQFPPRFRKSKETTQYLSRLLEECTKLYSGQLTVELRNKSWFIDSTIKDLFQEKKIVLTDTTKILIPDEFLNQTTSSYYIRIIGDRNLIPDDQLGKVYLNKEAELNEWVRKLIRINNRYQNIFVLINNRFSGYAINDAITLNKSLNKEKIKVKGFDKISRHHFLIPLNKFFNSKK